MLNFNKNIYIVKNILIYFIIINNLYKIIYVYNTNYKNKLFYIINLNQYYLYIKFYNINNKIINFNILFFFKYYLLHEFWNISLMSSKKKYIKFNDKKALVTTKPDKNYFYIVKNYLTLNDDIYFLIDNLNKKYLFNYLNSFFYEKNDNSPVSDFDEISLIDNLYYNYLFFYNYKLTKVLINELNITKWYAVYEYKNFYNSWFFNIYKVFNSNIASSNYFSLKKEYYLNQYFLTYQLKSVFWLLNIIFIKILKNIFYNNNIFINISKYDFDDYDLIKSDVIDNYNLFSSSLMNDLINIIILIFIYKDVQIFIKWIKINMSTLFYKKQNNFIDLIKSLFFIFFQKLHNKNNVLGYKIIFKGKLNKLGNVRKKKIIISQGKTSLSNINYKIDFFSDIILTVTGIINIKIIIIYI